MRLKFLALLPFIACFIAEPAFAAHYTQITSHHIIIGFFLLIVLVALAALSIFSLVTNLKFLSKTIEDKAKPTIQRTLFVGVLVSAWFCLSFAFPMAFDSNNRNIIPLIFCLLIIFIPNVLKIRDWGHLLHAWSDAREKDKEAQRPSAKTESRIKPLNKSPFEQHRRAIESGKIRSALNLNNTLGNRIQDF